MAIHFPPPKNPKKVPAANLARLNGELQALGKRYLALTSAGDYAAALRVNAQAKRLMPTHPAIVGDEALCHLRMGNHDQARTVYLKACQLAPQEPNSWDGLTEACGHLGLHDEVRRHGQRALALKDAQVTAPKAGSAPESPAVLPAALPTVVPPLSSDRSRNVIAFSLFGSKPRYCETAVMNVVSARELLPQWTCRFYVDHSVPAPVLERLTQAGAQVVTVPPEVQAELSGLMWRFLVLQDPGVDRYLLRDADSLVSTREAAAVQAWLESGRAFHVMRDYFSHTELMLAGMWGGCGGVFDQVRESMAAYIQRGQYLGQRVVDQHFLRACVWPTVRQSVLSHDSVFGFMEGQDFPAHAPHGLGDQFHVGSNLSVGSVGSNTALADGELVSWVLNDEHQQAVCAYATPAQAGQWSADLPGPYLEKIRAKLWSVEVGG